MTDSTTRQYTLMDITNDGFLALMAEGQDTREDLRLPDGELGDKIRKEFEEGSGQVVVTVRSTAGEETIIAVEAGS